MGSKSECHIGALGWFLEEANKNLLLNCDIKSFLLKTNGKDTEGLIFYFSGLKCFNYRWVDDFGVEEIK